MSHTDLRSDTNAMYIKILFYKLENRLNNYLT